jgi:hypothetical protein
VDERARSVVTPLVKGTFDVGDDGVARPAEKQLPINVEGQCWGEDAEKSSYKYEPEVAFFKPATDVVLIGHAVAPQRGTTELQVGITVGAARATALVIGDRVWFRAGGSPAMSRPVPFERIPLVYERAFGGRDLRHPDPKEHAMETRNPVGTGFRRAFEEGLRLPNLEHPAALIREFGDRPPPVGFGFLSPHWHPRAALAGTYDERWQQERSPLLPLDFDRRHLNAASAGLVVSGYLRGDEPVTAMGVTSRGTFACRLPGIEPPVVRVVRRGETDVMLRTVLDTVIVEPDERRLQLFWRAHLPLKQGPHDLKALTVTASAGLA